MKTVYTSVTGLSIPDVEIRHFRELSKSTAEWVEDTMNTLLHLPTKPERLAARALRECDDEPIRQAYFMIRGRSYFLDFFFPNRMIAIEIDGSSHTQRKGHDRRRDADFRSIGIRTIRVSNRDVMNGKLQDKLYKRLYRKA